MLNGRLYVDTPVCGRVTVVENVAGNLKNSFTTQFHHGPGLHGKFTLSLDGEQVIIDYEFNTSFIGQVEGKRPLFFHGPAEYVFSIFRYLEAIK